MALSVALPLSGLEPETYSSYSAFGLRDILAFSQSSPSLSVSSESSGIGSLGSLKSESINGISLPASPQNTDKSVISKPSPEKRVMYQGRNLLDLGSNLKSNWNMRYSHLPANNPTMFFNNRSQYHRLSDYPQPEYRTEACQCPRCHFKFTVA